MLAILKQLIEKLEIGVKNAFHHNKKYNTKDRSIAGNGNQIADTIYNVQALPLVMQVPMIAEQSKILFNEQMKSYGCLGDYISFKQRYAISSKFLEEVAVARNEFIKWAQDNSEDGTHLPPYKDCNAKIKELWTKYVKSSPKNLEDYK